MYKAFTKDIDLGNGRTISLETGKLAKQADGSVVLRMGKTLLLATVVSAKEAKENVDFMPLSVEYKEKFSALGRFPGGFMKRETRPSDYEILISRLIDRALRPLFPDNYHAETFVTVSLLSAEKETIPDALAGLAASAALTLSDIPFKGPISEVRVARNNGNFIVNPTFSELKESDIDIMVGATIDNILMVEGEMSEVSEEDMIAAIQFAHNAIKLQCQAQIDFAKEAGKTVKREYCHEENDEELRKKIKVELYDKVYQIAKSFKAKHQRSEEFEKLIESFIEANIPEEERESKKLMLSRYYHDVEKEAMRRMILDEGIRLDGRKTNEIRPIWCEVDCLPSTHGSAIFTRGETQAISSVTLGTKLDEKVIDEVLNKGT